MKLVIDKIIQNKKYKSNGGVNIQSQKEIKEKKLHQK